MKEAELEARAHKVILDTFPLLNSGDISHQVSFSVNIGRSNIDVGGVKSNKRGGRLDVLIQYKGDNLAVLELKKPKNRINDDDVAQGISYARLLNPMAPLVVISEGSNTKVYNSFDGVELSKGDYGNTVIKDIFKLSLKLSQENLDDAINALLGTDSEFVNKVAASCSDTTFSYLTGPISDITKPFVDDFLLPRKVTKTVINSVRGGNKLTILTGAPLSGKSNVLKEVCIESRKPNSSYSVLYIDSTSATSGIFRTISNSILNEVFFSPGEDKVRNWLRIQRDNDKHTLVIAIDGLNPTKADDIRSDIDELLAYYCGKGLSMILAVDDSVCDQIIRNKGRVQASQIGSLSKIISLKPLDGQEFNEARKIIFDDHDINFWRGAHLNCEYHWPRFLRLIVGCQDELSQEEELLEPPEPDYVLKGSWPSVTGLEMIHFVRAHYLSETSIKSKIKDIASAMLDDGDNRAIDTSLGLMSIYAGAVSDEKLKEKFTVDYLNELLNAGYLKRIISPDGRIYAISRLPEFVASEIAALIAEKMLVFAREGSIEKAVDYLMSESSKFPLVDIVGAQALLDFNTINGNISLELIECLLSRTPQKETISRGFKGITFIPGIGEVEIRNSEDGKTYMKAKGLPEYEVEDDGESMMIADSSSFLMLSHVAGIGPMISPDKEMINAQVIYRVGSTPHVMRRPDTFQIDKSRGFHVHNIDDCEVACIGDGVIEPITVAIISNCFFNAHEIESMIKHAVSEGNIPLVFRSYTAMQYVAGMAYEKMSNWAKWLLEDTLQPYLDQYKSHMKH